MYPALVTLSLILVFGSSAFMSISGLLLFFSNNTVVIVCMGLGMEIGKILTVSHIYRTWSKNHALAKTGYICIVSVLTLLTSFEVIGFLSQGHQNSVKTNHVIQLQIDALNDEESILKGQIYVIDATLKGLPKSHVTRILRERKNLDYKNKQDRLLEIIKQKADLKKQLLSGDKNLNSVFAIAEIFKVKGSNIVSIFISLLVMILEPLSIGLTVATNAAWMSNKKEKNPVVVKNKQENEIYKPGIINPPENENPEPITNPPKNQKLAITTNKPENANLKEELRSLQATHCLSVSQIAKITKRKKLKTCEGWLNGRIPTPPRALLDLQIWIEKNNLKEPDKEISSKA